MARLPPPVALVILLVLSYAHLSNTSPNKEHEITRNEVLTLSRLLSEKFGLKNKQLLGAHLLEQKLQDHNPQINVINGTAMVVEFASQVQKMLGDKIGAIERIAQTVEEANVNHTYDPKLEFRYYNAKNLNRWKTIKENGTTYEVLKKDSMEMEFTTSEQFAGEQINWTLSSIQVPVNIYNKDPAVINGIYFTERLNEVFYNNHIVDPTLTWQYFGSSTGFFRNYPGVDWGIDEEDPLDVDEFDSRDRPWYLQASHSPKDVVILMDTSGSMTGSREYVAINAIKAIIDTLLDDDFFNILKFAGETEYLEECFAGHLVQANSDNKELMKRNLDTQIKSEGIANFEEALVTAFNLLHSNRERGSNCNQAIMLLTDGAVENYHHIFEKMNKERRIRVFTYIIGRDVKNAPAVKWMACNNKGYYTQIATLADVKISVKQYIHVLSRPMVIKQTKEYKWTNVYMDIGAQGLKLMTTVSVPAFDKVLSRANEGILLGVAGVDVPINGMNTYIPSYRLGLNGYTFSITNNGYIMNHPDLRPKFVDHKDAEKAKPNYNSVDLSEVELFDTRFLKEVNGTKYYIEDGLRSRMVDGRTGGYVLDDVHYRLSGWDRIDIRDMNYYFTYLDKTPFRLGIAIHREFGMSNFTLGSAFDNMYDKSQLNQALQSTYSSISLDKWVYCMMNETQSKQFEQLDVVRQQLVDPQENFHRNIQCNDAAVRSVAEDAMLTHRFEQQHWQKTDTVNHFHANGILATFVGTRSGFMRYKIFNTSKPTSDAIQELVTNNESTLGAEFFQMAASIYTLTDRSDNLVIWVPTERDIREQPTGNYGILGVAKLIFARSSTPGHSDTPIEDPGKYMEEGDYKNSPFYNPYSYNSYSTNEDGYSPRETQRIQDWYTRQRRDANRESNDTSEEPEKPKKPPEEIFLKAELQPDYETSKIDDQEFRTEFTNRRALAAAVGFYADIDVIYKQFSDLLSGRPLPDQMAGSSGSEQTFAIQTSCAHSDLVDCYILDHNAYIVMSENKEHISKFFGQMDGNAMSALSAAKLFVKHTLLDQQGMCSQVVLDHGKSAKASANRPLQINIFSGVMSLSTTFAGLLYQLFFINLMEIWLPWVAQSCNRFIAAAEEDSTKNTAETPPVSAVEEEKIEVKYDWETCDKIKDVYLRNFTAEFGYTTHQCNVTDGDLKCFRKLMWSPISQTNLVLVTVMNDFKCTCDRAPFELKQVKKKYETRSMKCERLLFQKHRKRPDECENFHEKEDSKKCGRGTIRKLDSTLLILLPILTIYTIF